MNLKLIAVISAVAILAGCGKLDRQISGLTGKASEVCQDGVIYLQFTSGTSVKYNQNGTIATCSVK